MLQEKQNIICFVEAQGHLHSPEWKIIEYNKLKDYYDV